MLAHPLRSLPPMLHNPRLTPIPRYSKGPGVFFVLLRLTSIFTRTAISPSSWSRQWGSRYAIRAGRNLPDKEFRYLRMVIVTTAVYRGLNSPLRSEELTDPLNLPAPGRRQCIYSGFRLRMHLCFGKQSLPPGLCHPPKLPGLAGSPQRVSLIPRHGSDLPSSLTRIRSIALVFST